MQNSLRKPWDKPITRSKWMAIYYLIGFSFSLFLAILLMRGGFYNLGRYGGGSNVDAPQFKIAAGIWIILSMYGVYAGIAAFVQAMKSE